MILQVSVFKKFNVVFLTTKKNTKVFMTTAFSLSIIPIEYLEQ